MDPAPHGERQRVLGRYSLMPMLFYTPTAEQLQTQSKQEQPGPERRSRSITAKYAEAVRAWNASAKRAATLTSG